MELQGRLDQLEAEGLGLAAISYDAPEALRAFAARWKISFPLLSDAGSATIRRFGILNTVADAALGPGKDDPDVRAAARTYLSGGAVSPRMAGIPFPGTFIVDRDGFVTARDFEDFYVERSTASTMLLRLGLGRVPVAAARISGAYLDLTTYASDAVVSAGNRFTLALDIVPRQGMHVYAPGASSYRVIRLVVDAQPFVRPLAIRYPASETYHFQPLDERVPVYQKPFTLFQEIVIEGSAEAQAAWRDKVAVTLTGTLEYQACDDRVCYNPVEVPLSWTVQLRPLVRN